MRKSLVLLITRPDPNFGKEKDDDNSEDSEVSIQNFILKVKPFINFNTFEVNIN